MCIKTAELILRFFFSRNREFILRFLALFLFATTAFAASPREAYRVKIWNSPGGTIEVSNDGGKNWQEIGKVIYPTEKTNFKAYAASRWVDDGKVAATAVNAIHIKTATTPDGDGVIFSLLPKEFIQKPKNYRSYLSPDSSIYTNILAGKELFGGDFSPFVGNTVLVSRDWQAAVPIGSGFVPQIGDKIYLLAVPPPTFPKEIFFENNIGGKVTAKYFSGKEEVVAEVLRPVGGVGRFEGSKYAALGRIRANHAGVIDVSTSRLGKIGGFQIIPADHAADMKSVQQLTQWMIVGPADITSSSLEGTAPLFKAFIKPDYRIDDLESDDWQKKLLDRYLVEVKLKDKDGWQPLPVYEFDEYYLTGIIPAWSATALQNVTAVRILFPVGE
ncbi:MAG: hypothetical protein ABIH50_04110 [bacterium]